MRGRTKVVALGIIILMASFAIPHVNIWGFNIIGSGKAEATQPGDEPCETGYPIGKCGYVSSRTDGYFARGYCKFDDSDLDYQCFFSHTGDAVSCSNCINTENVWCKSKSGDGGYCDNKGKESFPICADDYVKIDNRNNCDSSGLTTDKCTADPIDGTCKSVSQGCAEGFFTAGICSDTSKQCCIADMGITPPSTCQTCRESGMKWCVPDTSGVGSAYCINGDDCDYSAYHDATDAECSSSGGTTTGVTECSKIKGAACIDETKGNCEGYIKTGLCSTAADDKVQCCLPTDKDTGTCKNCINNGYYYCQDDYYDTLESGYCVDRSSSCYDKVGDARFSRYTSATTECKGTQSNAVGNNLACSACINQKHYYCSIGTSVNLLVGSRSIASNQLCQSDLQKATTICAGVGTVISPGGSCPTTTCSVRCQNAINAGGLLGITNLNTASYPVGVCSELNPSYGLAGTTTTQQIYSTAMTGHGLAAGCDNELETCYCMRVGTGSSLLSTVSGSSATIAGTTTVPKWPGHPQEILSPKAAQAHELLCDVASNATVTFDVKPKLAQAGETIKVTGDVGKISNICKGYQRTCSQIIQMGCETHERVLWKSLSCKECPSGSDWPGGKSYSCIGEGTKMRWTLVLAIGGAAACALIPGAGCAAFIKSVGTHLGVTGAGATLAGGAAITAACMAASQIAKGNTATATNLAMTFLNRKTTTVTVSGTGGTTTVATALPGAGSMDPEIAELYGITLNSQGKAATAAAGANQAAASQSFTGLQNGIAGAGLGACVGGIIDSLQGPLNPASCISVCGKDYKTAVAPSPVCSNGGPVIGETETSYGCTAGSCEGFPNKQVDIVVYGPKGDEIRRDTSVTDASGKINYDFTAPSMEGDYNVVVSVPGLGSSSNSATGAVTVKASRSVVPLLDNGYDGEAAVRPLVD